MARWWLFAAGEDRSTRAGFKAGTRTGAGGGGGRKQCWWALLPPASGNRRWAAEWAPVRGPVVELAAHATEPQG